MDGTTLQALRRLLFFTVEESARLIGRVTPRSWQYWELGQRTIPEDVSGKMLYLTAWRSGTLAHARRTIDEAKWERRAALVWYDRCEDWSSLPNRDSIQWRPHQSVCAALLGEGLADLVTFDRAAFDQWRGRRADTEATRAAWAASRSNTRSTSPANGR